MQQSAIPKALRSAQRLGVECKRLTFFSLFPLVIFPSFCISEAKKYRHFFFLVSLQAFDELLLLKQGGRQIYYGPTGLNSDKLIKYFSVSGPHCLNNSLHNIQDVNPATARCISGPMHI